MWPYTLNGFDMGLRLWSLGLSSAMVMAQRLDPTRFDMSDHPEFPRMVTEKVEAAGLSLIAVAFQQQRIWLRLWSKPAPKAWLSLWNVALRPYETKVRANVQRLSR